MIFLLWFQIFNQKYQLKFIDSLRLNVKGGHGGRWNLLFVIDLRKSFYIDSYILLKVMDFQNMVASADKVDVFNLKQ